MKQKLACPFGHRGWAPRTEIGSTQQPCTSSVPEDVHHLRRTTLPKIRAPSTTKVQRQVDTFLIPILVRATSITYSSTFENPIYRAANGRAHTAILQPSPGLAFRPWRRFSADSPREEPSRARDPYLRPPPLHGPPLHWYPFLWNAFAMEWIGRQCIEIHSIPMDSNRLLSAEGNGLGKTTNESGGAFTTIPVTPPITWR